ncbi:MAG: phosphopantothenoylcysteine decarboxylase [Rickettsiales bacterium]|jgi:phosphopantothenoylcysteine decarboxylase/phosphopantothenate--cysteine ligase|nr:phosphopantothenoylcysteine decarboxylase [Rickettsiales bacterium]
MKVLVTAGPTYEPIDPVRFIGNRSSGKQGIAIATAFAKAEWDVYLIAGVINDGLLQNLHKNINVYNVQTAREMLDECLKHIDVDVAVHNAAVSDYRPEKVFDNKIKKEEGFSFSDIKFVENPDILSTFGHHLNRPKVVIGFAAETNNLVENAKKKLSKKNADFIMVNDVSNGKGFGKDVNKVYIVSKDSVEETKEMDKGLIGEKVVEVVNEYIIHDYKSR